MECEYGRQDLIQPSQVLRVLNAIRQGDVQPALLFAEREVAFAMDGEREDIRIVCKNFRSAIALMHVKVDHGSAVDEAPVAQELNGHGDIIEYAKTCALGAQSVVCSSAQRASPANLHGLESRAHSPAY